MFKPEFAKAQVRQIGMQIKKERKALSLNQQRLAKQASVNTQTIKRIESGRNASLITIIKVLKAMDLDLGSIMLEIEGF